MLPFALDNKMYQTGLAGSIVSMTAYIIASVFLYRIVVYATRDFIAGVIAVIAFSGPNILYMQSVPMSEMPYICAYVVSVYYLLRWVDRPERTLCLVPASFSAMLAMMTRYEAVFLIGASTLLIVVVLILRRSTFSQIEGFTLFYLYIPIAFILLWLAYNLIIFGNVFYFANGEFALAGWGRQVTLAMKPSERAAGNLAYAFVVYLRTVWDNAGWAVASLSLVGVLALLASKLTLSFKLAVSLLLAPLVVYPLGMYQGDWIVVAHPDYMSGIILNLRFGTFAIAGIAFSVAFLASKFKLLRIPVVLVILANFGFMFATGSVSTIEEAESNETNRDALIQKDAGQWLRDHWDGGLVLRQRAGNELVAFSSQVPFDKVIYEGDRELWTDSLVDPTVHNVKWIFMRGGAFKDRVRDSLRSSPVLLENYRLAYEHSGAEVYVRK